MSNIIDSIKKFKSQSVYKKNNKNIQSNIRLNNILKVQSSLQLQVNSSDLKGSNPNRSDQANSELRCLILININWFIYI